jgi:Uri superfamily endonuclease
MNIRTGYYVYVGSAFGSGGLHARLAHHLRLSARPHWHIDYLRQKTKVHEIWFTPDEQNREHQLAQAIQDFPGISIPLIRFGASDCSCQSHLFFTETRWGIDRLKDNLLKQEGLKQKPNP